MILLRFGLTQFKFKRDIVCGDKEGAMRFAAIGFGFGEVIICNDEMTQAVIHFLRLSAKDRRWIINHADIIRKKEIERVARAEARWKDYFKDKLKHWEDAFFEESGKRGDLELQNHELRITVKTLRQLDHESDISKASKD
jgi:hypothetical protein